MTAIDAHPTIQAHIDHQDSQNQQKQIIHDDGWSVSNEKMISIADNRPAPLIESLLPSGAVVTFAGQPGIGKSFVALNWAAAVATGTEWFGLKTGSPRSVVYVLGEGFSQFGKRIKAWQDAQGMSVGPNLRFVDGAMKDIDLNDDSQTPELIENLERLNPDLIIFDTFAMLARVKSENDNSEVGLVYKLAHHIVQKIGATVVLVHHTNKEADLVRGATAFRCNSDAVVVAGSSRQADDQTFWLSTRSDEDGKQRDVEAVKLSGFQIASPGILTRNEQAVRNETARNELAAMAASS